MASLFKKGSLFVCKPLLIRYLVEEADELTIQAAFSVPKKKFKRAVDRNHLKRKIREAHRLNQNCLKKHFAEQSFRISIIYIYTSYKKMDYFSIEKSMLSFFSDVIKA